MSQKQATIFKGGIRTCDPVVMCLKIPDTTIKLVQVTYLSFNTLFFCGGGGGGGGLVGFTTNIKYIYKRCIYNLYSTCIRIKPMF